MGSERGEAYRTVTKRAWCEKVLFLVLADAIVVVQKYLRYVQAASECRIRAQLSQSRLDALPVDTPATFEVEDHLATADLIPVDQECLRKSGADVLGAGLLGSDTSFRKSCEARFGPNRCGLIHSVDGTADSRGFGITESRLSKIPDEVVASFGCKPDKVTFACAVVVTPRRAIVVTILVKDFQVHSSLHPNRVIYVKNSKGCYPVKLCYASSFSRLSRIYGCFLRHSKFSKNPCHSSRRDWNA